MGVGKDSMFIGVLVEAEAGRTFASLSPLTRGVAPWESQSNLSARKGLVNGRVGMLRDHRQSRPVFVLRPGKDWVG